MHTPYTYLIKHIPSGKVYYGLRYAKNCHPSDLWIKYFTSSKDVKQMIKSDGAHSFLVQIRKTFVDRAAAIKWEITVLRRMKVIRRDDFINRSIPGSSFFTMSEEQKQKLRKPKPTGFGKHLEGNRHWEKMVGVPKTKEHCENISKGKKGKNFGRVGELAPMFGVVRPDSDKEKIRQTKLSQHKKWMNNGINSAFVNTTDVDLYLREGYTMGRGSTKFTNIKEE